MNSEFNPTPEEELEAQITALLLGELSAEEAAALREKIAADPALVKLHARLGLTIGLVEEAVASPLPAELAAPEGLKLAEEKREALLAAFKKVRPVEFAESRETWRSWMGLAAIILVLLGLTGLMLPVQTRSRGKASFARTTVAITDQLGEASEERLLALKSAQVVDGKTLVSGEGRPVAPSPSKTPAAIPASPAVKIELPQLQESEQNGDPNIHSVNAVGYVNVDPKAKRLDIVANSVSSGGMAGAANQQTPAPEKVDAWRAEPPRGFFTFGGGQAKDPGAVAPSAPAPAAKRQPVLLAEVGGAFGGGGRSADGAGISTRGFGDSAAAGRATDESKVALGIQPAPPMAMTPPPTLLERYAYMTLPQKLGALKTVEENKPAQVVQDKEGKSVAANGTALSDSLGREVKKSEWNEPLGRTALPSFNDPGMQAARRGENEAARRKLERLPEKGIVAGLPLETPPPAAPAISVPASKVSSLSSAASARGREAKDDLGKEPEWIGVLERPAQQSSEDRSGALANLGDRYAARQPAPMANKRGDSTSLATVDSRAVDKPALDSFGIDVTGKSDEKLVEARGATAETRLQLEQLKEAGDFKAVGKPISTAATPQAPAGVVNEALRMNPNDPEARKAKNELEIVGSEGKWPSEKVTSHAQEFSRERINTSTTVQDARSLVELGRIDEAEKLLKEAVKTDSEHRAASYYLDLIKEQRSKQEAGKNKISAKVDSAEAPAANEVEKLARKLETQEKMRDSVKQRIDEGKNIAKGAAVEVLDRAEDTGKAPTILERVRGVEKVARIEVAKDVRESSPFGGYDPYFLQTEFEKIKSQQVLNRAIEKLNLNTAWAEKFGGGNKLTTPQAYARLRKMVDVQLVRGSSLIEVKVKSDRGDEAARIANAVVESYREIRQEQKADASNRGIQALEAELEKQDKIIAEEKAQLEKLKQAAGGEPPVAAKPISSGTVPQPEVATSENNFSTFSLNVSDVSFKLAAASLEKGQLPEPASIRSEEFINAFDYRDPAAVGSAPMAFAWERARYPFAHNRDLLRFSVKTAASGREAGRPLNLVLLLDNSGSMERADRVRIIRECLRVLASQLQAQDKVSVVTFARTARLWVDALPGSSAGELVARVGALTPEGGTNLEEAMRVAYETAARHFATNGVNRVVLLTDGAANLGDVKPETLKKKVEEKRKAGIALDCFGIGWEGLNDDLLEQLSRNGDGRYGFVNTPEAASAEFAGQLAGALQVAASDVKVQVEFNPKRTKTFRQIGYAKHQLTKEQFRDNTVDAAEIGAAEAGNALYVVETNPAGEGPIATVRARFKVPGTQDYRETEWVVPFEGTAKALEQASPALRLAASASAFSEWLAGSPYAGEVTPAGLLNLMANVPEAFANDARPKQLEWMIRQAKSIAGK
jgi:Mg-chelatase subunit ChlD/anti-sigma factor RsiW